MFRSCLLIFGFLACSARAYVGSQVCAGCHRDIAATYNRTAMGRASGSVASLQLPGGRVTGQRAGVTYSAVSRSGNLELHYRKAIPDAGVIEGHKTLQYFIGSGAHGRGFLFEEQGQLFQSPIAYYGSARGWDLAPGYENEKTVHLSRKAEVACLNCHASGIQPSASTPFREGAISCERCHGAGEGHLAAIRSGHVQSSPSIVNPARLDPESRDGICAQCHLWGEARVTKPGRSALTFQPGERLADHVVPFVWATPNRSQFKVIGHFEGLWQSRCKRVSGDRLSCLTCHDPHSEVAANDKAAYYRDKCLACHQPASCQAAPAARAAANDSCVSCHMASRSSTDGQHTAFTDHFIRRPNDIESTVSPSLSGGLVPFWPSSAGVRESALAYAEQAWLRGGGESIRQVHDGLQAVGPAVRDDGSVAAQLAYTDDLSGDPASAIPLYRQALAANPENLLALTNLAIHLARLGETSGAIDLWRKALTLNPGLLVPSLNLAHTQISTGDLTAARDIVDRALSLNPDSQLLLQLRQQIGDKELHRSLDR